MPSLGPSHPGEATACPDWDRLLGWLLCTGRGLQVRMTLYLHLSAPLSSVHSRQRTPCPQNLTLWVMEQTPFPFSDALSEPGRVERSTEKGSEMGRGRLRKDATIPWKGVGVGRRPLPRPWMRPTVSQPGGQLGTGTWPGPVPGVGGEPEKGEERVQRMAAPTAAFQRFLPG